MRVCLLFGDGQAQEGALLRTLERANFAVCTASYIRAQWICAQSAEEIALIGSGAGCREALLLAERYAVGALILIGCPLRPRCRGFWRAERDLFSVVADFLLVQPGDDPRMRSRGAEILLRSIGSAYVRRVDMGKDFTDLWTNCKIPLFDEILGFLEGCKERKELAKTAKS